MKPTKEVMTEVIKSIENLDVDSVDISAGHEERPHPTEPEVTQARSNGEIMITIRGKIKDFKIKPWAS